MTEAEALEIMVPPGRVRPGKMNGTGGVAQIHLTRACTQACYGCTQGSNLGGKPTFISAENFESAVLSMDGYFGIVALFGGQPTLHPEFPLLCDILSRHVPAERRGLWTNALNGHGAICRRTFLPQNCNLNCHLDGAAYEEFRRDWPESRPFGQDRDSRHSPPWVAMKDVDELPFPDGSARPNTESNRWELITTCDVNVHWSCMLAEFRGGLRAWFCELAGAQSILHQDEPDYPDTGIPITAPSGQPARPWWQLPMAAFAGQARKHCHECGIPLRGRGELAQAGADGREQVSETHRAVFRPKRHGRRVELVTTREQLGGCVEKATAYLQNARE